MNNLIMALFFSIPSFAAVEFRGGGWHYGDSQPVTIQSVGVISDEVDSRQVTINFTDQRQLILTGAHVPLGLSLIPLQGKCIRVIPGYQFRSVNLILNCE